MEGHFQLDVNGKWTAEDLAKAVAYFEGQGVLGTGAATQPGTPAIATGKLQSLLLRTDPTLTKCAAGEVRLERGAKGEPVRRLQ